MNISVLPASNLSPDHVAAWDRLQRADATAEHPFLRPEFAQLAALECSGVEVAVLEDAGDPVGFFPFQRVKKYVSRAIAWQMSDMHGVVLKPGVRVRAKDLLRQARLKAWHFDHVPVSQETFRPYSREVDDSYFMDLSHGYEAYRDARRQAGRSLISQADRKSRKLARELGPLRFELQCEESGIFETLIEWKRKILRRKGYENTLDLRWVVPLMRRVAAARAPSFSGLLSALFAGDTLLTVQLNVRCGRLLSSWVPTYNYEFAKYSPGVIHHLQLAQAAAAAGIERIDMGRGADAMKQSLQSGTVPLAIGSVDRRPLHAIGTRAWYGALRFAKSSPIFQQPLKMLRGLRRKMTARPAT